MNTKVYKALLRGTKALIIHEDINKNNSEIENLQISYEINLVAFSVY